MNDMTRKKTMTTTILASCQLLLLPSEKSGMFDFGLKTSGKETLLQTKKKLVSCTFAQAFVKKKKFFEFFLLRRFGKRVSTLVLSRVS